MTSPQPYTRAEIQSLSDSRPERGIFCPLCDSYIPEFEELSQQEAEDLYKLDIIPRIKLVRKKTGCNLFWARLWALHQNGVHPLPSEQPSAPCPFCGIPLHPNAGQCLLCKMNWHDPQNPISLGDSIADQILNAAPGSTISVFGPSAYILALQFIEQRRPNDNLSIELKR
ncbi:MAG: hypothetical protein K0U86_10560 [Planctomycetes bacterium]|nr:hypothetical protein [Planctomycetota bacterium]MCH9725333.1 hypothetical protein [Planctomycetota bacterium]MCH9779447.1 hypothetical protein [Planctomycetota bacterium]MCH9793098.1 hypothetical protein [Planctomycetota bacterium]